MAAASFVSAGEGARLYRGVPRLLRVPQPAAGSDWSLTLPGEAWWRVVSCHATYTISTAVGVGRTIGYRVTDGSTVLVDTTYGVALSIAATHLITLLALWPTGSALTNNERACLALPDLVLPPGFVIGTRTFQIQPADQWSAIDILVEEHDLGPEGAGIGLELLEAEAAIAG